MAKAGTSRQAQLDRIAKNARANGASESVETVPSEDPKPAEADKDGLNLDDPLTQEQILNPEGVELKLSYQTIRLYPPSMMVRKLSHGFTKGILGDAYDHQPKDGYVFTMRVMQSLMASPDTLLRLYRFMAQLCGRPGAIDDKSEIELATEFAERTNEDDTSILFYHLATANGSFRVIKEEKKPKARPTKESHSQK